MLRFSAACALLIFVLFFGVLLGMQFANKGMKDMKGYDDPALSSALSIDSSSKEGKILGETVTSHDLEAKKQRLEDLKAYNFFSSLGKSVSGSISGGFEKLIGLLGGS